MSLKGDKYETTEEVKFRLEGTIVLYENKPVYISRVSVPDVEEKGEIARVFFYPLPIVGENRKEVRKFLSSRKFDLSPFKMGYMNHEGQALFLSRSPVRQNKQGLSQNTCVISDVNNSRKVDTIFSDLTKAQGFVDMVNGVYPDFKSAGDMLDNKETSSVAVSRNFAFRVDHDLEALILTHKGVKCGLSFKGDKTIKVPDKFRFLREEMEEHRIPIA